MSDKTVRPVYDEDGEVHHIGQLKHDPRNARLHNKRNLDLIETSLTRNGAGRSILLDENYEILAGNGVVEAAARAGIEKVRIIEADGDEIIAVKRSNLTEEQKLEMALFDNRTAELAEWDIEVLGELADEVDMGLLFFDDEWEEMTGAAPGGEGGEGGGLTDPDAIPEAPAEAMTQPGDLWRLGGHRLMCADATDEAAIATLLNGERPAIMVTDPPYGVEYDSSWREQYSSGAYAVGKIANDDRADWREVWQRWDAPILYIWHASLKMRDVWNSIEEVGYEIRNQIIWNKSVMLFGRGHYHWKHEPCMYAVKKGATATWVGDRSQTTVWDVGNGSGAGRTGDDADNFDAEHISQKPVELFRRPLKNHVEAQSGALIAEPFAGSGSQLIAAEELGLRCAAMELEPKFCDIIIRRWVEYTGQSAVRESDGLVYGPAEAKADAAQEASA